MKRGEIASEEVVKIVLGVAGIAVLLYLVFTLGSIFTFKSEIEQAKNTLEEITSKIESLKNGEIGDVLLLAPDEWYFVYLSAEEEYETKTWESKGDSILSSPMKYTLINSASRYSIQGNGGGAFISHIVEKGNKNCEENCLCICESVSEVAGASGTHVNSTVLKCATGVCESLEDIRVNPSEEVLEGFKIGISNLRISKDAEGKLSFS